MAQFTTVWRISDDWRGVIGKDTGLRLEVADVLVDALEVTHHASDSFDVRRVAVEVTHGGAPVRQ